MRFDTPVYFQHIKPGEYDTSPENYGNYGEDTVTEVMKYASVTDTGADTLQLVYGELKQGSKTVRLQNHYNEAFDRIRIGETIYRVDRQRKLRTKHAFIVSEVQ